MEELTDLEKRLKKKDDNIFSVYIKIKEGISSLLKAGDIRRELNPWDSIVDYYTLHGYSHCESVLIKLNYLLKHAKLNQYELFYILSAVWLHDIGMIDYPDGYSMDVARERHHITSVEYFKKKFAKNYLAERVLPEKFEFTSDDEKAICNIIRYHRRREDILEVEESFERKGKSVFLRFLAAIFRIADGLDLDNSRAPFYIFENNKKTLPYLNRKFWEKHFPIKSIVPRPEKGKIEVKFSRSETPEGRIHGKDMHSILLQVDYEIRSELESVKGANVADYDRFDKQNRVPLGNLVYINDEKKPTDSDYNYNLKRNEEKPFGWEIHEHVGWRLSKKVKDKLMVGPLTSLGQITDCFVKTEKIGKFLDKVRNQYDKPFFLISPANTGKSTLLNVASWEIFRQREGIRSYVIVIEKKVPTYEELMNHLRKFYFVEEEKFVCIFDRVEYISTNIPDPAPLRSLIQKLKSNKYTVCGSGRTWEEYQNREKWRVFIEEEFEVHELPGLLMAKDIDLFLHKFKDFFPEEEKMKRFWTLVREEKEIEVDSFSQIYKTLKEVSKDYNDDELRELVREKVKRSEARYEKIYQSLELWEYNVYCLAYKFPGIYKSILNEIISQTEDKDADYVGRMANESKVEIGEHVIIKKGEKVRGIEGAHLNDQSRLILEKRRQPEAIEKTCNMILRQYLESELHDPNQTLVYFYQIKNFLSETVRLSFVRCVERYKADFPVLFILSLLAIENPELYKFWEEAVNIKEEIPEWIYLEILKNFSISMAKHYNDRPPQSVFRKMFESLPMDKEIFFDLGVSLGLEELPRSGLMAFERAIKMDRKYAMAWNGKGSVLCDLGRHAKALVAYEKSIELDPTDAHPWYGKGNVLSETGSPEEALAAYEKSIELDPKLAAPWNGKGNVLLRLKQLDKALLAYEKSIELDPKLAAPWNGKGNVLLRLKQLDKALLAYEKSIELNPKDAHPWNGKGTVLRDLDQPKKALAAFERSIDVDPKFAYPWYGRGNVLRDLGQPEEALAAFERSIELDPKLAYPWHGKGNVLRDFKQPDKALAAYNKSIELDPKLAYPWYGKGTVLEELDRLEEALTAYEKSIVLDSRDAHPWNGKGNVLKNLDRLDEALAAFKKSIELDPNLAASWNGKGNVLVGLKLYDEALDAFEKSIELDPKLAAPWNGKGNALRERGRPDKALSAFEKSIELDPTSAYPWNGKGDALRDLDRPDEALAAFEKSIELDPKLASPWNGKAMIFWRNGKLNDAKDIYEEAIKKCKDIIILKSNYSELLILLGEYEKAIKLIEESIGVCSTNKDKRNLEVIRITAYVILAKIEKARQLVTKFIEEFDPKIISNWDYSDISPAVSKLPKPAQQKIKVIQDLNLGKGSIEEAKRLWEL